MNYGYMPILKMRKQKLIRSKYFVHGYTIPKLIFKPRSIQFQKCHSSQHFATLGSSNISLI